MNVPNTITLFRLVVTAACFACLEGVPRSGPTEGTLAWFALWAFVFAAVTDFVDGYLARTLGQVTAFGRVADPLVDKVLVCGTFVTLLQFDRAAALLPAWVVVLVITREFLVTAVRGLVEAAGEQFPADALGKLKMVVQSVTAAALLALIAGWNVWHDVARIGVWVSLVLTIASGFTYVWKARKHLFKS